MPKASTQGARAATSEETVRALRRVMVAVHARMRAQLGKHGLTFPQLLLLKHLRKRGLATPKEVADALEVTPANVTGMVDRLEREGWVSRSRSNEDRRVVHLRLTEDGHARMARVAADGSQAAAELFEGWREADLLKLKDLLAQVRLRPEEEDVI